MSLTATGEGPVSATTQWLHELWGYYQEYTHTAIHSASAAALTAFGLLIFIDPLFVVLAMASYICPPVILYSIDSDVGKSSDSPEGVPVRADSGTHSDSDSDSNDGDMDSDGADADADGVDADADG